MNGHVASPSETQLSEPSLVVFGRDDAGKPHASWFDAGAAELATKAAGIMKMRVLHLETEEQRAAASQLPRGRVFGSGRAFTPFVRVSVYKRLVELAPQPPASSDGDPGVPERTSQSEQALAADRHPAGDPGGPEGGNSKARSLDEIGIGSVVLASEGHAEGWYEVVVLSITGEMHTLKWRDYPEEGIIVRRLSALALLPADAP